jgi:transcriptional regulator with XRE-family HTH domain
MAKNVVVDDRREQKDLAGGPTLPNAVKALRIALGDTQTQFALRLGVAISTAVRYESTRAPSGDILSKLYWLAVNNGLTDVAQMFHRAVFEEWSDWAAIDDPRQLQKTLENRWAQALSNELATQGSSEARFAEWVFMRCAQKVLRDAKYEKLRGPVAEAFGPMLGDLMAEAKQTLEALLEGAPNRTDLKQAMMVRFLELLPPDLKGWPKTTDAK